MHIGLRDVQTLWEKVGQDDPFWGVVSWDENRNGPPDVAQFFAAGDAAVAKWLHEAEVVLGTLPAGVHDVLDFGCGVGRLSRALAARFDRVVGVDISEPMIGHATRLVGTEMPNARFQVNTADTLPFGNGSFDLVFSAIVLQHMSPKLAKRYIVEFLRVLRPHGFAIIQIPDSSILGSQSTNPIVRGGMDWLPSQWREEIMRRRAPHDPESPALPMHGVPRVNVIRLVEHYRWRVAAVIEDDAAGPNWRSFHYVLKGN